MINSRRSSWSGVLAASVTLLLSGATASWAAELAGKVFLLEGYRLVAVAGTKTERSELTHGDAVLSFSGAPGDTQGGCQLDTYYNGEMNHSYPCTWSTVAGKRRFLFILEAAPLKAELEYEASYRFGAPVEVTPTSVIGNGTLNARTGRIVGRIVVKGSLSAEGDTRASRRFKMIMVGRGSEG